MFFLLDLRLLSWLEMIPVDTPKDLPSDYVFETKIGFWFLGTKTWREHVIKVAINDLISITEVPLPFGAVILDVGCGQGSSLVLLDSMFRPSRLIGIEPDIKSLAASQKTLMSHSVVAELKRNDSAEIDMLSDSVDILFCHQTFHHLVRQKESLAEFFRILKPGGFLLFSESTRAYIHSWIIRLFFRHPMHMQKTANEYIIMIQNQGFIFSGDNISFPYLWWSRKDLGAIEWFGRTISKDKEQTLVNVVARKPE